MTGFKFRGSGVSDSGSSAPRADARTDAEVTALANRAISIDKEANPPAVGATEQQIEAIALNTDKETYPSEDKNKLAAIDASATDDQTGAEIITALVARQGADRLPASAIKDLPASDAGGEGRGLTAWASGTDYAVSDIRVTDDKIYECIVPHRSGPEFVLKPRNQPAQWKEISKASNVESFADADQNIDIPKAKLNIVSAWVFTDNADKIPLNRIEGGGGGTTQSEKDVIAANKEKVGITPAQADEITANNLKVGITPAQAAEVAANTEKVGITPAQAAAITVNSAKVSGGAGTIAAPANLQRGAELLRITNLDVTTAREWVGTGFDLDTLGATDIVLIGFGSNRFGLSKSIAVPVSIAQVLGVDAGTIGSGLTNTDNLIVPDVSRSGDADYFLGHTASNELLITSDSPINDASPFTIHAITAAKGEPGLDGKDAASGELVEWVDHFVAQNGIGSNSVEIAGVQDLSIVLDDQQETQSLHIFFTLFIPVNTIPDGTSRHYAADTHNPDSADVPQASAGGISRTTGATIVRAGNTLTISAFGTRNRLSKIQTRTAARNGLDGLNGLDTGDNSVATINTLIDVKIDKLPAPYNPPIPVFPVYSCVISQLHQDPNSGALLPADYLKYTWISITIETNTSADPNHILNQTLPVRFIPQLESDTNISFVGGSNGNEQNTVRFDVTTNPARPQVSLFGHAGNANLHNARLWEVLLY